ncbi:MAG: RNA polymerase sigma factor [Saprospiraceae bacterium]|nr:RNA polymerase sigma factor [Saprospiraceae bacterium]MDX1940883.1 RNA polymerase sigma factor [Saprospiraceae bacterium]
MAEQNVIQAVSTYGKQLFGFIRGRVPTDEDAEDILQDVWVQLSNQPEVEAIESVSAWLYRVARNRITDWFRKKKPESLEDYGYEDEDGEWNIAEVLLMDSVTPEDEHLRELFWEALFAALDELPEKQSEVFILNELEQMTLQEIADAKGENLKTIISRKGYAVKHLRKRLEDLYKDLVEY